MWHVTSTLKRTITKSTLIWVIVLCTFCWWFTLHVRLQQQEGFWCPYGWVQQGFSASEQYIHQTQGKSRNAIATGQGSLQPPVLMHKFTKLLEYLYCIFHQAQGYWTCMASWLECQRNPFLCGCQEVLWVFQSWIPRYLHWNPGNMERDPPPHTHAHSTHQYYCLK